MFKSLSIKKILVIELFLTSLSFMCPAVILVLKIINGTFVPQIVSLQYTQCDRYIQEKYSYSYINQWIQNCQLILAFVIAVMLIVRLLYVIFVQYRRDNNDIANDNKFYRIEYCLGGLMVICLACTAVKNGNEVRELGRCGDVGDSYSLVFLIVACFGVVVMMLRIMVGFWMRVEVRVEEESSRVTSHDSQGDERSYEMEKFFQQDSRQIREQLLNHHTMPIDAISFSGGMSYGNKFTRFKRTHKNNAQKPLTSTNNPIFTVQPQEFIMGPGDIIEAEYDRTRVNEVCKEAIKKLQQKGYEVEQRPYVEKTILKKRFDIAVDNNERSSLKRIQMPIKQQSQGQHQQVKPQIQVIAPSRQFQIILSMDTAEQRTPSNIYTADDIEPIQMDKIFYREYLQKESKQKERLKKLIMSRKKQEEFKKEESDGNKCSYHQYVMEDMGYQRRYAQMREYAGKKEGGDVREKRNEKEELVFYKMAGSEREQRDRMYSKMVREEFVKGEARQQGGSECVIGRKRQVTWSMYGAKNPLEIIRGRMVD